MSSSLIAVFDQAQSRLPDALRAAVNDAWHVLREELLTRPPADTEKLLAVLPKALAASEFVSRTCQQQPQLLRELLSSGELVRGYKVGEIRRHVQHVVETCADETALKQALRRLRLREMLRLALRDLAGWADLHEVVFTLTELADACVDGALQKSYQWATEKHGTPRGATSGEPQQLVVLGLGKLGGGELNFSSDIDLIFCYPEEGELQRATSGDGLSNHEFFVRLGQTLIAVLNEATADGFVFRVDMRLRPNGASGPLALSFDAMEQYYQLHGRDWERYAFVKARAIAGDIAAGERLLKDLKPFVYRKYLDYGALEAIRRMKAMIEREIARKGMAGNIKLGRGGIREIEFIAQALQLIRGGREPQLQERALLVVLPRLAARGLLEESAARELAEAYVFLRNVEHRLQMLADQQTQQLPADELNRQRVALGSGFEDWSALSETLERQRTIVHQHFATLLRVESEQTLPNEALALLWHGPLEGERAAETLRQHGYSEPQEALRLLRALRDAPAYQALSTLGRERTDRVVPLVIIEAGKSNEPIEALQRLASLLEAIGRRTAYFSLMADHPQVLTQFVKLGGASPWIANWIAQHPILLDELLDPSLYELPTPDALRDELRQRLAHIPADDLELAMEVLREFRHAHVLRVAATDVGPGLAPEQTGEALAVIASGVLAESVALARADLERRHGQPRCPELTTTPGFAVIAYGKLGSRELGYGSDLDIIFLYEGCKVADEGATDGATRSVPNEQFFARLGQRVIHLLTTRTPGGILYDVDMRLRPSGKSGPLVASLDAFGRYQRVDAWTWEHQALVRARPVAGDAALCAAFSAVRREVLCRERDAAKLKAEVAEMRAKMQAAQPPHEPGNFDIKHDRGGIVDIEFMVQYAVLRSAREHPELIEHTDNIHLLQALADAGCIERAQAQTLTEAFRRYLSMEHRLKLMERRPLAPRAELGDLPVQVAAIWDQTFS